MTNAATPRTGTPLRRFSYISFVLFRQSFLEGIRNGSITVAFRRWQRPTVRAGGTLLTHVGQLAIVSVTPVTLSDITAADSERAGYPDRDALLEELRARPSGQLYRIELGDLTADPRIALRSKALDASEAAELISHLERLDRRSPDGPWTTMTLRLIELHPGVRALDLARMAGQEKLPFKVNVRKLKRLGLTQSLETGYRLSHRGSDLLKHMGTPPSHAE